MWFQALSGVGHHPPHLIVHGHEHRGYISRLRKHAILPLSTCFFGDAELPWDGRGKPDAVLPAGVQSVVVPTCNPGSGGYTYRHPLYGSKPTPPITEGSGPALD